MDTCSFLRVSIWLTTFIELNSAQIYSSIPIHVFTVPSPYPWSPIRAPETPISRKLISYPSDILVQSNTIYYPPNSNNLQRNYFLPNPAPGKNPIIFRPTSLHRNPIPIRYEYSRVGNSLKTQLESIPKAPRRSGFVLDNSLRLNVGSQSNEPVQLWESKSVPVKPFPFTVYDEKKKSESEILESKVESFPTTRVEGARVEAEATTPAETTTLTEAPTGLVKREPEQFYKKEKNGRVIFGFHTEEQTRMESRDADAKVYGAYAYFDPTGNPVRMQYWDEGKGFHTAGNRLPQNVFNLPQSVTDTPEVQAARKLHLKLYEQTLAHLTDLQNLRPPTDNGVYEEPLSGAGSSSKPTAPPTVSEEDDDDEIIIDSQSLPDNDYVPFSSDAEVKEGHESEAQSQTEQQTEASQHLDPSGVNPTPNAESLNDPESVVIENPEFKSVSKRSIPDEGRTGKKVPRHNAVYFDQGFTGNGPSFPSQFPLFPAYSILPDTRVFTAPTQFRPSPLEEAHPLPGKFAPSVKTETFKEYYPSKTSSFSHGVKLLEPAFSDVAHRFQDSLFSKTPVSAPSGPKFPSYSDDFTHVFQEQPSGPAPLEYSDEPHPWLTAPNAPQISYEGETPASTHKTRPTKYNFAASQNHFNTLPANQFNVPEILASNFLTKDNGPKKNTDFHGSNPLFSGFYNSASLPSFLFPQSSQTIIRSDLPPDYKYHGSGPFHYFPKAPLPSLSYHVSSLGGDSSQYNFPSASQLPFSRPFMGHDYTLVDKNFPSSSSSLFFSNPFAPVSEFSPTSHFSSENFGNNHGLPIGVSPEKGHNSESTGGNSGSKSGNEASSSSDKDKKPESSVTPDDKPDEQTTIAVEKEPSGLKIVVQDTPTIEVKNEISDATNSSGSESNIVQSTEKPDVDELVESTETNESGESTESIEESATSINESQSNSDEVSLTKEGEKNDSLLVVDGRLSAEESTSVIESITEMSTEAATERTGNETEKTGNDAEKVNSGTEKPAGEAEKSDSETEKPGNEADRKENVTMKTENEVEKSGGKFETETKVPEETGESANLVRRHTDTQSVPSQRSAVLGTAVHDTQVSPKQRPYLVNYQLLPAHVTTD